MTICFQGFPVPLAPILLLLVGSHATPVTIKRTPVKGQKLVYQSRGSIEAQGKTVDLTSRQTKTITDVSNDGTYTTESTESDLTVDGNPVQVPAQVTSSVYRVSGELVSMGGDSTPNGRALSTALVQIYLPSNSVNVGDAWTYTAKKDDKLGIVPFVAKMKYLGPEKIEGIDTWKIQEDVLVSEGTSPAAVHITVYLDVKDGSIVEAMSEFENYPAGPGLTLKGNMVLLRRPTPAN